MRVLLDENISDDLKKLFLGQGFDVVDLKEKGLRQLPDEEIIHMATRSGFCERKRFVLITQFAGLFV